MKVLWLLPCAACLSFCFTWIVRRYALARHLVDVPNDRSSHNTITARGGGLAIVLTFVIALLVLGLTSLIQPSLIWAICGGGGLVALVGFIDDHRHIPAHWRLLAHFLAAGCTIFWLNSAFSSPMAVLSSIPLWLASGITALFMVWLVNLYNFMDGIDAIASIEAITVCLGGALVFFVGEPAGYLWAVPALLLASVSGFLYWNYPPARIFMGDGGSGFLGFVLGVFCIYAGWIAAEVFWAWIILLGVFIVDASVALFRRLLRRRRLHEAHRSHAYQYASRKYGAHEPVSLAVGAINLVWLMPVALLVAVSLINWAVGLLIAYLPLLWLAFRLKSGATELQEL